MHTSHMSITYIKTRILIKRLLIFRKHAVVFFNIHEFSSHYIEQWTASRGSSRTFVRPEFVFNFNSELIGTGSLPVCM